MPHIQTQRAFCRTRAVSPKRAQPTILMAEDSSGSREMMRVLLALKRYRVIVAKSGTAVAAALADQPDMIRLGLELPKKDGFGITRNQRCQAQFKHIPIIIVSGHEPLRYKQQALDAGCTDYLLKPIDFDRLDAILKRRLPLSR